MIKIFGYVRESTMQQVLYGYNIEEQKRSIENYCKLCYQDYELEIYEDRGKSATTLKRPELKNLLDNAKKAKANIIIFHSIDRLARNIADLIWLTDFFDRNNIEVVSVMETTERKTAIGRNHFLHSGLYAQLESERTSERTIRAYKQGVVEGKYPFSGHPLGYDKIDKHLYPSKDQRQRDIIDFIFTSASRNTYNYIEMKNEIKKRFDYAIKDDTIRLIINNKLYVGIMEYRDIVIDNYCEPIVPLSVFMKANENSKIKKQSHKKTDYLFKNLVRCSNCNNHMVQTSGTSKHKKVYSYYQCLECRRRASEEKIVSIRKRELQIITDQFFKEDAGYTEKKNRIEKLRETQRILVEKQKEETIDVDTFYELFIHYEEEINELTEILNSIKVKDSDFDSLEKSFKKEIIQKFIKEVDIVFAKKTYKVSFQLY